MYSQWAVMLGGLGGNLGPGGKQRCFEYTVCEYEFEYEYIL